MDASVTPIRRGRGMATAMQGSGVASFELGGASIKLNEDGSFRAVTPIFWIYYPDLRPMLAKYDVYNGKNYGAKMSWEELFESRMFSSRIIKSTINNPNDFYISSYVKDPILALLEGENIKEKVFNYEQDLWSY